MIEPTRQVSMLVRPVNAPASIANLRIVPTPPLGPAVPVLLALAVWVSGSAASAQEGDETEGEREKLPAAVVALRAKSEVLWESAMDKYRGAGGAANKKVKFPELTVADCATLPRSCTSFYTDHEDLRIKHGSPRAGRRRDLDLDVRSIAVEHEVRSRSA